MFRRFLHQLLPVAMTAMLALALCSCGTNDNPGHPPVIASFSVSPVDISSPQDVTLNFHVTGADTVTIDQSVGDVTGLITKTVYVDETTTFTLAAVNTSGTVTAQVTVHMIPPGASLYVADYTIAKESVLRAIPVSYINTARTTLHVAYNHTSHGTHVSYGVYGLPDFKTGDSTKFGVTSNAVTPDANKLDFHDNQISGSYSDLSQADANWTAWVTQVRTYLDNAANSKINVMMWSWCDISGHNVNTYLTSMQTLINEYGQGGSKIGTGTGKTRTTPVTFIFMTGHAVGSNNSGTGKPKDQAKLITDYCKAHNYYCIDYYSIDSHAMNDAYYEDVDDNANSAQYGGNFYQDWQTAHTLGEDWFYDKSAPGGTVTYGQHNTQYITANRKAFAFWWVMARIAGFQ